MVISKYRIFLLFITMVFGFSILKAQEETKKMRLGLDVGFGKQEIFPYNSPDYSYNVRAFKGLINYRVKTMKKFSCEIQLEPGIYSARHRLLNEFYIQPVDGADYLQQREILTKEITITEYAFNAGFVFRYTPKNKFSIYILAGVGPMYSDTRTERLAKGFAFSDVGAVGFCYRTGKLMFEIRPGVRHVSNADLKMPNAGHNSSNIDFGISLFL